MRCWLGPCTAAFFNSSWTRPFLTRAWATLETIFGKRHGLTQRRLGSPHWLPSLIANQHESANDSFGTKKRIETTYFFIAQVHGESERQPAVQL